MAILVADALENMQLFGITANILSGDFDRQFHLLHIFTWIKWGGISAIFLVLSQNV